jgi:hypothetical protein
MAKQAAGILGKAGRDQLRHGCAIRIPHGTEDRVPGQAGRKLVHAS